MSLTRKIILRYTVIGVVFGACFPAIGTLIELSSQDLSFSFSNTIEIHRNTPLLVIIDLAPIILGAVFGYLGSIQAKTQSSRQELKIENEGQQEDLLILNESLKQKGRDLQQLAYVTAHDLRSTLRGISSLNTFMKEEEDEAERLKYQSMLEGRVDRMDKLISSMLRFLRTTNEKNQLETIDLKEIVDEFSDENKSAEISLSGENTTFLADKNKTRLIFKELIDNSLKFSSQNDTEVNINIQHSATDVTILYEDNGPGIDLEFKEKIFLPFTTLERRDETENIGIGLAIVKRLLNDIGADIGLIDAKGAKFEITIPLKRKT